MKTGEGSKMCRKLTTQEFKDQVYQLVQDEYQVLGEYKGSNVKIQMKHMKCGLEYPVKASNFKNGKRCPNCSTKAKKTTEQFKEEVYELVRDEYKVLGSYEGANAKIQMRHQACGLEYDVRPQHFLGGVRCPKCNKGGVPQQRKENRSVSRQRLDTIGFKQRVYRLVQDEYEVLGEYKNSQEKILMKHVDCGLEYYVRPSNFSSGKRCPQCAINTRKTMKQFKEQIYSLVKDEYEVLSEYISCKQKVLMKHKVCGSEYEVIPNNFLTGSRCPICNRGGRKKKVG